MVGGFFKNQFLLIDAKCNDFYNETYLINCCLLLLWNLFFWCQVLVSRIGIQWLHSFCRVYKLLDVLEFNSARKRMSVIVKDEKEGKILLLSKGADRFDTNWSLKSINNFFIKKILLLLFNIFTCHMSCAVSCLRGLPRLEESLKRKPWSMFMNMLMLVLGPLY